MSFLGGGGDGGKTATAGTVIQYLVPPKPSAFTRLTNLSYISAGTAHTLTILRTLGRTKVALAAASGQAVATLVADPGAAAVIYGGTANAIAANDFVAIRHSVDGITRLYKVSSVSGLAVTMTANLGAAVAVGDDVWFFGITSDTDGRFGSAHPALLPPVSVTTTYTDRDGGLVGTFAKDEPVLVNSNNAVAAGTIAQVNWQYTKEGP